MTDAHTIDTRADARPGLAASRGALLATAMIAGATVLRLPTLGFPLTEEHAFRQTQTAFPAVIYAQQGIDLLNPQVPILGPPWTVPFEFPIIQAVGSLFIRAGVPVEITMRGLSLASFVLAAALLWRILDRHAGTRAALIALVVFLFSPFALLWSRTSMVEYPAVAGALAFMLGTLEWDAGHGRRWLVVALVGGSLAAVIKITTAVFWLAPVLMVRRRATLLLAAVPAVLSLAWTQHADAVKGATAATSVLTSAALTDWNFGGNRLSVDMWLRILGPFVTTIGLGLTPIAIAVLARRERRLWLWFGVALIGPPLLFMNLFWVHDYYAAAVTPAIAALVGGGLDRLLATRWALRSAVAGAAIGVALAVFALNAGYWGLAYRAADPEGVLRAATVLAAAPDPIAVRCPDWSPAAFFYAHRRGYIAWKDPTIPPGWRLVEGGCA